MGLGQLRDGEEENSSSAITRKCGHRFDEGELRERGKVT
jgi:hypothetical protein